MWRYSVGVADYSRGACARSGDPLGALNRVALRDDAPALALRGIAMVQHGHFPERDPMSARSDVDGIALAMIQVVQEPFKICRGVGQRCRLGCGERSVRCSTVLPRRKPPPNAVPGPQKWPRTTTLAGEVGVLAAIPLAREKKRGSVAAEPQSKEGRRNPQPPS